MSKARGLADLGNAFSDGALSNRNLIINSAMQVAQRGTSATGVTSNGYYAVDRMHTQVSSGQSGTHTVSQSTDAPSGFLNSYKINCTTAEASPNQLRFGHRIEGYNVSHLDYNTSNAKELTLSFWVKSNVTGTYAISVETSAAGRYFNTSYTITSANTWEYKTISIVGDTASALNTGNGIGFNISWWLAAPSSLKGSGTPDTWVTNGSYTSVADNHGVNLADSTSNYFQITGVQLEVGDTATPFEHRSYGDELQRCQRYYQKITSGNLRFIVTRDNNSSTSASTLSLPVGLRASPTVSGTSTKVAAASGGALGSGPSNLRGWDANSPSQISIGASSGVTATTAVAAFWFNTDIDAEL